MAESVRIIARLDIKGKNLIKGIHLEGLRVLGDPKVFAHDYYENGIDELIYMDVVASLYGRNNLTDIVKYTAENVFVPFTVGGGIRSVADIRELLRSGADRVAINTAAIKNPQLIKDAAEQFGSQCIVLSIEAKQVDANENRWEAFFDNGREPSGLDVVEWAKKGEELGAGEIMLTSIDQEGTRQGFNTSLMQAVTQAVAIPVIASGGFGCPQDFVNVVQEGSVSAVAIADALHYRRYGVDDIRQAAKLANIPVRTV